MGSVVLTVFKKHLGFIELQVTEEGKDASLNETVATA